MALQILPLHLELLLFNLKQLLCHLVQPILRLVLLYVQHTHMLPPIFNRRPLGTQPYDTLQIILELYMSHMDSLTCIVETSHSLVTTPVTFVEKLMLVNLPLKHIFAHILEKSHINVPFVKSLLLRQLILLPISVLIVEKNLLNVLYAIVDFHRVVLSPLT